MAANLDALWSLVQSLLCHPWCSFSTWVTAWILPGYSMLGDAAAGKCFFFHPGALPGNFDFLGLWISHLSEQGLLCL